MAQTVQIFLKTASRSGNFDGTNGALFTIFYKIYFAKFLLKITACFVRSFPLKIA
ncbi:hypothetical protein F544_9560 [Bibersteinia trehalosi USDA-ARS-USMARC-190]|uniref:Uncharacterized protein n=1 Tax=Bibersteinia trehalosi USDA-ARS-USMARC-190 TaxID=1263832 RepID=W0R7C5_BIBTR|nr:hypothetical protein F544_9560 [Bibersteinia trehalosi USDA-ARS-USMARC-190]